MLHVPVQFVDLTVKNSSWWIRTSVAGLASLINAVVPVKLLQNFVDQVDNLTVRCENNDLIALVRVKEHQQVNQSVLSWDFHIELLDLVRDRNGELVVAVSSLALKPNSLIFLHQFSTQHFNFLRQSCTYEVNS